MLRNIAIGVGLLGLSITTISITPIQAQGQNSLQLQKLKQFYKERMQEAGSWKWLGTSTCVQVNAGELTPKEGVGRMVFAAMVHSPTKEEQRMLTQSIRQTCTLASYSQMLSILKRTSKGGAQFPPEDSSLNQI